MLQKTPQDVAEDSGHMNIAEFLGGATVLTVSVQLITTAESEIV